MGIRTTLSFLRIYLVIVVVVRKTVGLIAVVTSPKLALIGGKE